MEHPYGKVLLFAFRDFPFPYSERFLQMRGKAPTSAKACRQYERKLGKLAHGDGAGFSMAKIVSREQAKFPDARDLFHCCLPSTFTRGFSHSHGLIPHFSPDG